MRIKLAVSLENENEVKTYLEDHGIEISDDAEFVLTENSLGVTHIKAKQIENGDKTYIDIDEIIYIESYGHTIEITSTNGVYNGMDTLKQLLIKLDEKKFSRINKSTIIAKSKVKEIRPSLSMKFTLIMSNGKKLEVTRGFYAAFKEAFNI